MKASWAAFSLLLRLILSRKFGGRGGGDYLTLALEAVNYVFFLMIVEGMAFTVRKGSKYRYCIASDGVTRISSTECNCVYAILGLAGVDLLMSFIAGGLCCRGIFILVIRRGGMGRS